MQREIHWVLAPLAVAVAFIFIAPVFAGEADENVALTTNARSLLHSSIDTGDAAGTEMIDPDSRIATGSPMRLSPLAGNDSAAWDNANSIHAWQRPRHK